jgi:hypothetical protein
MCKCGEAFAPRQLPIHEESECQLTVVFCSSMCGQRVARRQLAHHLAMQCSKRTQTCPLKCGAHDLYLDHVDDHVHNKCPQRFVQCCWDCGISIIAADVEEHQSSL